MIEVINEKTYWLEQWDKYNYLKMWARENPNPDSIRIIKNER